MSLQPGLHVIQHDRLAQAGLELPQPWMGLLDALRMLEGHLPAPPPGQPLGVVGLDALLRDAPAETGTLLRVLRDALVEGRSYFTWKQIPVVLVVQGVLEDAQDGSGLHLKMDGRSWALAPLLGTRMQAAQPGRHGWFWSPQIG